MELELDVELESKEHLSAGGLGTESRVHPWDERADHQSCSSRGESLYLKPFGLSSNTFSLMNYYGAGYLGCSIAASW